VIAAPTSGFEQFGQVFQPPLCQTAPARNDIAATSHVLSVCHKFARKEKKRTLTQPNESLGRDSVILWKTFPLSSERRYCAQPISKNPGKYGSSCV
jgi:hypothetical protein